jgi:release factor glutamine methyltransferase
VKTREALAAASSRLEAAGVPSAQVDAELLLAHVLDVPRSKLALIDEVHDAGAYDVLVSRRVQREPLQHITGRAPFRHMELAVGPGVFVPRPETELLVDAVLPMLRALDRPIVVDLCAGSGALGLAIAAEVPGSRVVVVENSPAAVDWLRRNVMAYLTSRGVQSSVAIETEDVTAPELFGELRGHVDVVVSNPPYVPTASEVAPEVRADPSEAVFSGPDGLDIMPSVIARAAELLRPGGVFAVEHDDTNQDGVLRLLAVDGRWIRVEAHCDLAGRPRSVVAVRA